MPVEKLVGDDRRSKNRLKEHSQPGHSLSIVREEKFLSMFGGPATLFSCSCTWLGWLRVTIEDTPPL